MVRVLYLYHIPSNIAGVNIVASIILGASRHGFRSLDAWDTLTHVTLSSRSIAPRIAMLIGGITDTFISVLLLVILFQFLSLYHRRRAEQFSGISRDENEAGLKRLEQRAVAIMVRSIYTLPNHHSYMFCRSARL